MVAAFRCRLLIGLWWRGGRLESSRSMSAVANLCFCCAAPTWLWLGYGSASADSAQFDYDFLPCNTMGELLFTASIGN
jgi:hypothetical protein